MSNPSGADPQKRVPPERTSLGDILSDQFDLWKVRRRIELKRELMKAMAEEEQLNDQIRDIVKVRVWSSYLRDPTKIKIDVEPPIQAVEDDEEDEDDDFDPNDGW